MSVILCVILQSPGSIYTVCVWSLVGIVEGVKALWKKLFRWSSWFDGVEASVPGLWTDWLFAQCVPICICYWQRMKHTTHWCRMMALLYEFLGRCWASIALQTRKSSGELHWTHYMSVLPVSQKCHRLYSLYGHVTYVQRGFFQNLDRLVDIVNFSLLQRIQIWWQNTTL